MGKTLLYVSVTLISTICLVFWVFFQSVINTKIHNRLKNNLYLNKKKE